LVEEVHSRIGGSRLIEFKGGHIFFLWENMKLTDTVSEFLQSLG
jgi:hypothetical protein